MIYKIFKVMGISEINCTGKSTAIEKGGEHNIKILDHAENGVI